MEPTMENPFQQLVELMRRLRSPEGCPWDREQTPQSLQPYLLEETYEVLEALDEGNPDAICEELGDLLLQVVFVAQIFAERNAFTIEDVARAISSKLIRRHPHVFAGAHCNNIEELNRQWERIKREEKAAARANESDPERCFPALLRGRKHYSRNQPPAPEGKELFQHIEALWQEAHSHLPGVFSDSPQGREAALGHILFLLCGIASDADIDPEQALRRFLNKKS